MAKLYLSPSKVADFENCRWQYMLKHVWNWREKTPSINLIVGDCLDKAIMAYLGGKFVGQSVDPVRLFADELETQIASGADFGSKWTPENVKDMGVRLMEQFPEYWERSGLTMLADTAGEPIMQRLLELDLGDDIVFRTKLDLACATREGDIAIIDVKSASMEFPEVLAPLSDQITAYNIAVLAHAESLGLQSVDKVGFIELIKKTIPKTARGEGPVIREPKLVDARDHSQMESYLQKVRWTAAAIVRQEFARDPRYAHNTPCSMCFAASACSGTGDVDGIDFTKAKVLPDALRSRLAA